MDFECFCSLMKQELKLRYEYSKFKSPSVDFWFKQVDKVCYIMNQLRESAYNKRKLKYIHNIIIQGLEKAIKIEKNTISYLSSSNKDLLVSPKTLLLSHKRRLEFFNELYNIEKITQNPFYTLRKCFDSKAPKPLAFNNPIAWYMDFIIYPDEVYKNKYGFGLIEMQIFFTFIMNCMQLMIESILSKTIMYP